jgi:hypothetical protein
MRISVMAALTDISSDFIYSSRRLMILCCLFLLKIRFNGFIYQMKKWPRLNSFSAFVFTVRPNKTRIVIQHAYYVLYCTLIDRV